MTSIVQLKQLELASFYTRTFAIQTDSMYKGILLDHSPAVQYYINGITDSFVLQFEY
jgi:hypothetical protein